MPLFRKNNEDDEYEIDPEVTDYLSDMNDHLERIESLLTETVNQGDKQVEFLSRLVTLFESAAREAREARNGNPDH